jgi:hypothetical protein
MAMRPLATLESLDGRGIAIELALDDVEEDVVGNVNEGSEHQCGEEGRDGSIIGHLGRKEREEVMALLLMNLSIKC